VLKTLTLIRQNAIALAALFIALGGTSYAAFDLPAGSVGNKQLKNHSITPIKFDAGAIGGYVRYWARMDASGKVIASRPRAKVVAWYASPTGPYSGGIIRWGKPIGTGCFALATIESFPQVHYASAVTVPGNGGVGTQVRIATSAIEPVDVAVICPQP
jgi:hypothetical protein